MRQATLSTFVLVAALSLSSCGGGGSSGGGTAPGGGTPASPTATKSVAASIDASLSGASALALPQVTSIIDRQSVSTPIAVPSEGEHPVFALDAAGNIALAGSPQGATSVTLTAESTVLTFGVMGLATVFPDASPEQLRAVLRAADGFDALVSSIGQAVQAGRNPLDQPAIQAGFEKVLASALAAAKTQVSAFERLQAVASNRLEPGYEPIILNTTTYQVSLANSSQQEFKLASKVFLRNTSALQFTAGLIDPSGGQRASKTLEGAGATVFSVGNTVELSKPFDGAFSIRLFADDAANANNVLKSAIELVIKPPGRSLTTQCVTAIAKVSTNFVVDVSFPSNPENYLYKAGVNLLIGSPDLISDCAYVKPDPTDLVALLKAIKKIAKIVGFVRIVSDQALLPAPIPETGVCVDSDQYQISCVAEIRQVGQHQPMMPKWLQPIKFEFLDKNGKNTSSPPFGLDVRYSQAGLFTLNDTLTQIVSGQSEGTGIVTLTDPATDQPLTLTVTVTNGAFEKTAYKVAPNGTAELKFIDPNSGKEVFRSPLFDPNLTNASLGSFRVTDLNRGSIFFVAGSQSTLTPQPIFLSSRNSGSTIMIEAPGGYWSGSYVITQCSNPLPDGATQYYWESPCYAYGMMAGNYGTRFYFRDGFPVVIFGVVPLGGGADYIRSVATLDWNSSVDAFGFDLEIAYSQDNGGVDRLRGSGTRQTRFVTTSRTATIISGTFTIKTTSGTFGANGWVTYPTTASGQWSATLLPGPGPMTDMMGKDFCDSSNMGVLKLEPDLGSPWILPALGGSLGPCRFN